jgi:hypothetical protein
MRLLRLTSPQQVVGLLEIRQAERKCNINCQPFSLKTLGNVTLSAQGTNVGCVTSCNRVSGGARDATLSDSHDQLAIARRKLTGWHTFNNN